MSDFKAKMHQIQFRLGLCPRPCWGSLQTPNTLAGFKEPTSKGTGGEKEGVEGGSDPLYLLLQIYVHVSQTHQCRPDFETSLSSRIFVQFFDNSAVVFYSTTGEKFDDSVAESTSTTARYFYNDVRHCIYYITSLMMQTLLLLRMLYAFFLSTLLSFFLVERNGSLPPRNQDELRAQRS